MILAPLLDPDNMSDKQKAAIQLRKFKRAELEVADRVGKGAYGGVWQATLLDSKQDVVVKVMWPDPDLDPEDAKHESPGVERRETFKREIEIMRRVGTHPNIIGVLGATADSTCIVFEQAITDLHQIIKKQKRSLGLPTVIHILRDILLGVQYLHSNHFVHRDLKPANILVFKNFTCKLGDFGLAREFTDTDITVNNEVSTLWYRAPELLMGTPTYTTKIDIWSVGCIVLEMLTGRCQMMGDVNAVCDCPFKTHYNYNEDQLQKVFGLVGSPTKREHKALLSKMHCLKHFEHWPVRKAKLPVLIQESCTFARYMPAFKDDTDRAKQALKSALPEWEFVVTEMLSLDPARRPDVSQALELPLLSANEPSQQGGTSTSPAAGGVFQRAQSAPSAAAKPKAVGSNAATHSDDTQPGSQPILKRLLLNPFRRVTSSATPGGGPQADHVERASSKELLDATAAASVPASVAVRKPSRFSYFSRIKSAGSHHVLAGGNEQDMEPGYGTYKTTSDHPEASGAGPGHRQS